MDPLTIGLLMSVFGGITQGASTAQHDRISEIRQQLLMQQLSGLEAASAGAGTQRIGEEGGLALQGSRAAVAQRLAASGRSGDTEAALAPIEQSNRMATSRNLKDFLLRNSQYFNQLRAQAYFGSANRPQAPTTGETIGALGQPLLAYGMQENYLDRMGSLYGQGMDKNRTIFDRMGLIGSGNSMVPKAAPSGPLLPFPQAPTPGAFRDKVSPGAFVQPGSTIPPAAKIDTNPTSMITPTSPYSQRRQSFGYTPSTSLRLWGMNNPYRLT